MKEMVQKFTLHGSSGGSVLDAEYLRWIENNSIEKLGGHIEYYSWLVNGEEIKIKADIKNRTLSILPDFSGFICIESAWRPDNCVILDARAREVVRLTVPWRMTGSTDILSGEPSTSFSTVSTPYDNPITGEPGRFGISAWVERAGKFYFELNYESQRFLWCRRILD